MPKSFHFTVEGEHNFPLDMLRYDACFPMGHSDVRNLNASAKWLDGKRQVKLVSTLHAPTTGRWESFGWSVIEQRTIQ